MWLWYKMNSLDCFFFYVYISNIFIKRTYVWEVAAATLRVNCKFVSFIYLKFCHNKIIQKQKTRNKVYNRCPDGKHDEIINMFPLKKFKKIYLCKILKDELYMHIFFQIKIKYFFYHKLFSLHRVSEK